MTNSNDKPVFTIVLAAGAASRFGTTKQLAEFEGETLARRAVAAAVECCGANTVLVAGHDWQAVANACSDAPGFLVINEQHEAGMGSSIARGVRAVRHVASAVIVLLADQPLVTGVHLRELCDAWSGRGDEIVASQFAGTLGPPVLFAAACFDELAELTGDAGAKQLLRGDRYPLQSVHCEAAASDIDTPEDLRRISRSVRN